MALRQHVCAYVHLSLYIYIYIYPPPRFARRREWEFITQVLYRLPFTVLALVLFLKNLGLGDPSPAAAPNPVRGITLLPGCKFSLSGK